MGKPKTPTAPPPPDPYATADAQTTSNRNTAIANANLNRIDQHTPYGSIIYNVDGTNEDGTPRYSQTQTLSPAQQELLDSQNQQDRQINGIAGGYMDSIAGQMGQPFDMSGAPALRGSTGGAGGIATSYGNGSRPLFTFGDAGPMRSNIGDAGAINGQPGPYGDVQAGLDFSGAPQLPGVGDFSADRLRVEEALMARQNDGFGRQEDDLRTRLANQGVTAGSEAFDREMDTLNRSRVDARTQATLAGGQEQSRMFGLGMSARQQDVGERTTAGSFVNQSQAQRYAQALGTAGFANDAQEQRFGQMATEAGFENQTQAQRYAQELSRGQFGNDAQAQGFSQDGAVAQFGNQSQAQRYGQLLSEANLSNTARQQEMQEQAFMRSLPLNEFSALRSGTQITQPSFTGVDPVAMAGTNVGEYINQNFQAQQNQYNAQMQARNNFTSGLFSLGGSAALAASDVRVKRDIERIGTTPGGLGVYEFRYLNDNDDAPLRTGVMAQEVMKVRPDAVVDIGGVLHVDYAKVA